MPLDAYAPCPCGSGKKLKFCCLAISSDMEKIEKLIDNHQPRMALQSLEKVAKKHGDNPWVVTRQAASLLSDDRAPEAKTVLLTFLRNKPDHPSANALYAMATLQADGLPEARKAIRRAFRFSIAAEPIIVAGLAEYMAEYHWQLDQFMAARQHMVMALQLGNENQHREVLDHLMEFDTDGTVPFSFRGGQSIPPYTPPEAAAEKVTKAQRLASVGCWGEAAAQLAEVTEIDPNSSALWRLVGLFQAWDGNEAAAAVALHKSAELETDFDVAVETETLAQELDRNVPDHCTKLRTVFHDTNHVAKLLTVLDGSPQLIKLPHQPSEEEVQPVAGVYAVLDRVPGEWKDGLPLSELSRIVGRVSVFDSVPEKSLPPRVLTTGLEGPKLKLVEDVLKSVGGELIFKSADHPEDGKVVGAERPDDEPMTFDYFIPRTVSGAERRRARREFLTHCWESGWRNHPLRALDGKSPAQVGTDPAYKLRLAAAIECLDGVADDMQAFAPVEALRQEFGIPEPKRVTVADNQSLQNLSLSQLRRVDLSSLTDDQFRTVAQRAALGRLGRLSYVTLKTWAETRDGLFKDDNERITILSSLADLASRALLDEESLAWNNKARAIVEKLPNSFERMVEWKLRELQLVMGDKERQQKLFHELWHVYGSKLPRLRQIMTGVAEELGLERPWDQGIVTPGESGGLWTPESASNAPTGQKLWTPGNE